MHAIHNCQIISKQNLCLLANENLGFANYPLIKAFKLREVRAVPK